MGGIKWRSNSAEYLTELVRTYLEKGVKLVAFMDDNFTLSAKRVAEICRNIEENGLDFMWGCLSRPDWVAKHPDVFKRMVECGCKIIYMSAESCSDDVLKGFKKGTKVDIVKRAFDIVSDYSDVLCIGSLIIGAYNDTVETMNGSIEYLKKLNPHLAQFSILTPYPGTPLYNRFLNENSINSFNWADYTCEKIVFNHPLIDNTYVQRRFYEAYSEYYSRWEWQDKIKGLELSGNILPLLPKSLKSRLFYSLIVKRAKKAILRHIADATKNFEEDVIIPTTSSSLELDAFLSNLRKNDKRVYRA
jgi:anaerobic magnesium-protoporphyrin IX monomethyl ester cyclase